MADCAFEIDALMRPRVFKGPMPDRAPGLTRAHSRASRMRARDRLLAVAGVPLPSESKDGDDRGRFDGLKNLVASRPSRAVSHEPQEARGNDVAHQLTVYTCNLILMVMAFPIGMAILIWNILGGENLRSTAHSIALTGMGLALMNAGLLDGLTALI